MSGPLRVWMVDSHAVVERGGAVQAASLAAALARRGHEVTCVFDRGGTWAAADPGFARLRGAGVELAFRRLGDPLDALRFGRALDRQRPNVLHTHKNRALRFAALALLGRPRPVWVANRGTVYRMRRHGLDGSLHARLDRILAVCEAVRDALVRDGFDPDRVEVVYGGFDPERFHPGVDGAALRAAWGVPAGAPLVGVVGSLRTPKKGHTLFLEAAAVMRRRRPDLRFVLVGDGRPDALRARARALGLEERVVFAGFVPEVERALAALDVVVCASLRGEGLTGALREALAMERPVVSSDVGGNREIVIDGETGRLVPPGDVAALADAVLGLLDDPNGTAALAARGRARVDALCRGDARAARVETLYRALLARRSAGP